MPVSKIPASYHLKRMIKSDDAVQAYNSYVAWLNQMYLLNLFTVRQYWKAFGIAE